MRVGACLPAASKSKSGKSESGPACLQPAKQRPARIRLNLLDHLYGKGRSVPCRRQGQESGATSRVKPLTLNSTP